MKMFNLIGIGERAGSGVPDIFAVWEQEGWKEPEVEEQYGPDKSWHETYTGLIDANYLERQTLEKCIATAHKWADKKVNEIPNCGGKYGKRD